MARETEERRRDPRFLCSGKAEMRSLGSGFRASGKVENLSLGGCLLHIEDRHSFRRGESVEMTFCVRQLPLRVQASVRQLYPGYVVGVAFTLLSARGKRQLETLIEELAEILRDQLESLRQQQKSTAERS